MKPRADLTQDEALTLLRSDQMQLCDYLTLCEEQGWDKSHGLIRPNEDGTEESAA